MKDNWIEFLFNLFEQSLSQLKKGEIAQENEASPLVDESKIEEQAFFVQANDQTSIRILNHFEQAKLTKPSYQFLMRMKLIGVISNESFEQIMNILQFSDSRIVNLEETKWAIRKVLSTKIDMQQLAFLDLVLYDKELAMPLH